MPLQFIFVTSLSNKCYSYHLAFVAAGLQNLEKKEKLKFNRL